MSFASSVLVVAALALALMGAGTTARAQSNLVSYVGSGGADSGACATPAAPCQTISGAVSKTINGGTVFCVNVIDGSDPFGAVSIDRSVVIDCHATVHGISINAPSNHITLRNLVVNAFGNLAGIDIIAATSVHIENVFVTQPHFQFSPSRGIYDHRIGPGNLFISNSDIVNINGSGLGILIVPLGVSTLDVVLDNVRVRNAVYGMAVGAGGRVTIKRSIFAANSFGVEGDAGASLLIEGSTIDQNTTGVQSSGSVRLSNNDFTFNGTAISGAAATFGTNRFSGNTFNGTAPTPVLNTDIR